MQEHSRRSFSRRQSNEQSSIVAQLESRPWVIFPDSAPSLPDVAKKLHLLEEDKNRSKTPTPTTPSSWSYPIDAIFPTSYAELPPPVSSDTPIQVHVMSYNVLSDAHIQDINVDYRGVDPIDMVGSLLPYGTLHGHLFLHQ